MSAARASRNQRERLHHRAEMIDAPRARFQTRLLARAPYFFADLHGTGEADERAAAEAGRIEATGLRYVGIRPAVTLAPVGTVHNGRTDPQDTDHWGGLESTILLEPRFREHGLTSLTEYSHAEIVFFFDRLPERDDCRPLLRPRGRADLPEVGVFADRGPRRPNRLGTTVCEIVSAERRELRVRGLDAMDGTPVLDIKPVMRQFPPRRVGQPDWVDRLMADYFSGGRRVGQRPTGAAARRNGHRCERLHGRTGSLAERLGMDRRGIRPVPGVARYRRFGGAAAGCGRFSLAAGPGAAAGMRAAPQRVGSRGSRGLMRRHRRGLAGCL